MILQLPPGTSRILHRQLESYELLVFVSPEQKDRLKVEALSVGMQISLDYFFPDGENLVTSVSQIITICQEAMVASALLELKLLKEKGVQNVLN